MRSLLSIFLDCRARHCTSNRRLQTKAEELEVQVHIFCLTPYRPAFVVSVMLPQRLLPIIHARHLTAGRPGAPADASLDGPRGCSGAVTAGPCLVNWPLLIGASKAAKSYCLIVRVFGFLALCLEGSRLGVDVQSSAGNPTPSCAKKAVVVLAAINPA